MPRPRPTGPDATFNGAHAVTSGTYTDSLGSGTDVDVFRFRLESGQSVRLSTDNGGDGEPDTVLAMSSGNGRLIATDDDGAGDLNSLLELTNDGRGGDFYVAVSSFPNFPTGRGGGNALAPDHEGGEPSFPAGDYSLSILIA